MANNLHVAGGCYISYRTMIKVVVGGVSIGNVTKYSPTTSRHQKLACVHSCDVQIDNVPQGHGDLYGLAVERGLIGIRCDSCEALVINGVYCHESGCPNRNKRYIDGAWVRVFECRVCGDEVYEGSICDCQNWDWEESDNAEVTE